MSGAAQVWDQALAQGRFLLQRPASGGAAIFPPREFAPGNGEALEWIEASGDGTVYAMTWVQRKPPEAPYNVALIDLAEGARMIARVEGVTFETLRIGMSVKARIADGPVIVFDPVEWIDG
jgi:uncharacterized OB-fold protein